MNVSATVGAVLCGLMTAAGVVLGVRQLREKGYLLNNAWIYASSEERANMNKRPYYRQSGISFLLIAAYCFSIFLYILTRLQAFCVVSYVILGAALIYAILSTLMIYHQEKDAEKR